MRLWVRSLRDLNCEAIGFSHKSGKKEEERRAYFIAACLFFLNLTCGLISREEPYVLHIRYCTQVLSFRNYVIPKCSHLFTINKC